MACGTPVAVANAGSLPDLVQDAGILFDPRNNEEITHALRRILTEPGLREDLRVKGRARAKQFPWEATVEGTLEAYRAALASAG
jgi:glycosyltransferase involved in cell wall biosynthesis